MCVCVLARTRKHGGVCIHNYSITTHLFSSSQDEVFYGLNTTISKRIDVYIYIYIYIYSLTSMEALLVQWLLS